MENCVVCLEPIRCARAFQCGHAACAVCLVPWIRRAGVGCMSCRAVVQTIAPVFAVSQTENPTTEEIEAMATVDAWRPVVRPTAAPASRYTEAELAAGQAEYLSIVAEFERCKASHAHLDTLSGEMIANVLVMEIQNSFPHGLALFGHMQQPTPILAYAVRTEKISDEALHRGVVFEELERHWSRYSAVWRRLSRPMRVMVLTNPSIRSTQIPTDAVGDKVLMKAVCLTKPTWVRYCADAIRDEVAVFILTRNPDHWTSIPRELRTPAMFAAAGRQACGCRVDVARHAPACRVGKK